MSPGCCVPETRYVTVRGSPSEVVGGGAAAVGLVPVGVTVVTVSGASDVLGVVAAGRGVVVEGRVSTGAEVDGAMRPVVVAVSPPRKITNVPITARTRTMPATAATQRQRLESS